MKKMKKILVSMAAAVMMSSLVIPVQAAPAEYTYKVRVFAGNQGTVNGGSVVEYTGSGAITFVQEQTDEGNGAGGIVTVGDTSYTVKVPDDGKYYAKGIRISGKDEIRNSYSKIEEDADYVIAYGILKDRVEYTVRYLDAEGNALVAERHYYGSAGDKPIVAFLNVDGYMPNAYNITKTLSLNEAENVFTFTYTRMNTGGTGGGDTTITTEEVVTTTNTTTQVVPAEGEGAGAAGGGVTVVPGEGGDAQAEAEGAAGETGEAAAEEESPAEPQELVDLDDEEVPLANVPGAEGNAAGSESGSFFVNMPPAVIVGVVSMAVLVVAAAWYLLFARKKGTNEGNEEK